MKRATGVAVVLAALLAVPGSAAASGTNPTTKRVIGGFSAVSSCGALSGAGVSWNSTGGTVTSVTLSSIPSTCVGGTLSLTIQGSAGAALGTVSPVTISGTTQTLTFSSGAPTASAVTGAALSVVGP